MSKCKQQQYRQKRTNSSDTRCKVTGKWLYGINLNPIQFLQTLKKSQLLLNYFQHYFAPELH